MTDAELKKIRNLAAANFKKRHQYQISLAPGDNGTLNATVQNLPSDFFAVKLYLMPVELVFEGISTNGKPWQDYLGKVIDRDFFETWKSPALVLQDRGGHMNELRLKDNGVQVVVKNGDRIELKTSWRGEPQAKCHAVLMGFVES